jgi:hypothetical protein
LWGCSSSASEREREREREREKFIVEEHRLKKPNFMHYVQTVIGVKIQALTEASLAHLELGETKRV